MSTINNGNITGPLDTTLGNSSMQASSTEKHSQVRFKGGDRQSGAFTNFFSELAEGSPEEGAYLNEDRFYHQRHHSGFSGSSQGAFFGLDDLVDNDMEILSNMVSLRNQLCLGGDHSPTADLLRQSMASSHDVCITYVRRKRPKILSDRYLLGDTIGRGSYGKVKDCLDLETLRRYAMKLVSKMAIRKIPSGVEHVENEIRLMRGLSHPNVVRLEVDFVDVERDRRCILLEYCLGSIHDLQANGIVEGNYRPLPEWQAHGYFIQVIEAVDYLHSRSIIHKDLKPGNMLLTADEVVKITDFGVSEQLSLFSLSDLVSGGQTTPAIQPPEVAIGTDKVSGYSLDVYSCGVSLYFMVVGQVPFNHPNRLLIFDQISEGKYTIPDHVGPLVASLIRAMMCHNPQNRYTLRQVQHDEWIKCSASPPYLDKVDPLQYLVKDAQDSTLSVLPRLETLYDWEENIPEDEEEEVVGTDVTFGALEDSFSRLAVGSFSGASRHSPSPLYPQELPLEQPISRSSGSQHQPIKSSRQPSAPSDRAQSNVTKSSSRPAASKSRLKKPNFCKTS